MDHNEPSLPPEPQSTPAVTSAAPAVPEAAPAPITSARIWVYVSLLVAVLIVATGVALVRHKQAASAPTNPTIAHAPAPAAPSTSTDTQSLTTDLSAVNGGLSKENQDETAADGAVNDQTQQISVPTN